MPSLQRSRRRNEIVPRAQPLPLALAAACLFTFAGPAARAQGVLLPQGPNVVRGAAAITSGSSLMTVKNSNGTIIDWRGFSIGSGGTVRFDQANASSQVLNRVVGSDPSRILGSLQSNGKVWLLNPHGVLFGKGARVDVAGLVASTLGIGNDDWAAGRYTLTNNTLNGDETPPSVVNDGHLSALGGRIALVAGDGGVANNGLIEAPGGQVVLAAGTSVDLVDTGAPNITLRVGTVTNLGSVLAPGGRIDALAAIVNQQGLMRADALEAGPGGEIVLRASLGANLSERSVTSASGTSGGRVTVDAGSEGTTVARGNVQALGSDGAGGQVHLLGRIVSVAEGAVANASGATGGGEVLVGGSLQAKDDAISDARHALVQSGATLAANAQRSGHGGRVAVHSEGTTMVGGRLSARGAGPGGNGGQVETSGVTLDTRSLTADASAAHGRAGQWLAQAGHVAIADSGEPLFNTTAVTAAVAPTSTPVVTPDSIETALDNGTNVKIVATGAGSAESAGDITMDRARLSVLPRTDVSLSLDATRRIFIEASSLNNSDGAALSLSLRAGDAISLFDTTLRTWSDRTSIDVQTGELTLFGSSIESDGRIRMAADQLHLRRSEGGSRIASSATGDAIVISGHRNDGVAEYTNTSGANAVDAANGRWLFYAAGLSANVDPSDCECSTRPLSELPYAFSQHGASFAARREADGNIVTPRPGNGLLYAAAPNRVTFDGTATKTYDGNARGTIARDAIRVTGGLQAGERAVIGDTVAGTYDSRNTDARSFTPQAGAVAFIDARGRPVFGYDDDLGALQGRITPATLTLIGATAADKSYDATTSAQITSLSLGGLVGDEQLGFVASGNFDDANAGVGKTVRGSVASLSDGANGGLASNYTLRGAGFATTATVSPRIVTVNATAADKTYDATTAAQITSFSIHGLVGSEQLGAVASGVFDDPNAGVGKTVRGSISGLANGANGGLASNYTLRDPSFTTTATIRPALLTVASATAADRTYDTTSAAQITSVSLRGLVGSEQLGVSAVGAFDDANADVGKTVRGNVTGLANGANGGLVSNYTLRDPAFTTTATVSPATLTYRADAATWNLPMLTPLSGSVSGLLGEETLAGATTGTLRFTAPNEASTSAGTFAVQGGGLSARNYVFVQHADNAIALTTNRRIVDGIVVERVGPLAGNELYPLPPPLPAPAPVPGRTTDVSPWLGSSAFDSLLVGAMSQRSLSSMLSARERYKARLFAEAISRLEREPGLADAPDCKTAQQVETGDCLITESLKREMTARSTVTQAEAAPTVATPAADATATAPAVVATADAVRTSVEEQAAAFAARRSVKSATLPQIERKVAVLIGIDEHADTRIPKLANAANDARTIGQLLDTRLGYETVVLANAGKQQIVRTLNQLALTLGPKDSVVVYYAGHGQLVPATGLGYWQPADADATRPETWLSNADIGKLVSRLGASQVALVSDSCYSGSLVSEERIRPSAASIDPGALLNRRAAVVMSSGGNEPVFDDGKNGHSLFAFGLMQALQQVPTWQAGGNVFERVRFTVAKELPQRPRYGAATSGGHEAGGDYVFERRELE